MLWILPLLSREERQSSNIKPFKRLNPDFEWEVNTGEKWPQMCKFGFFFFFLPECKFGFFLS